MGREVSRKNSNMPSFFLPNPVSVCGLLHSSQSLGRRVGMDKASTTRGREVDRVGCGQEVGNIAGPSLHLAPLHPYLGDYEKTFSSIRQATFLSVVSKVHKEGPSNSGARKSRNLGTTFQLRPEYGLILVSRDT